MALQVFGGFHAKDKGGRALGIETPRMQPLFAYSLLQPEISTDAPRESSAL